MKQEITFCELKEMPTLKVEKKAKLKIDTGTMRVWIFEEEDRIFTEQLIGSCWVDIVRTSNSDKVFLDRDYAGFYVVCPEGAR